MMIRICPESAPGPASGRHLRGGGGGAPRAGARRRRQGRWEQRAEGGGGGGVVVVGRHEVGGVDGVVGEAVPGRAAPPPGPHRRLRRPY